MANAPKESNWKSIFILHPEKVRVLNVINLKDAKLNIQEIDGKKYITSIEVLTPKLTFLNALNYSQLIANRLVDFVSFQVGYSITCFLKQINEEGKEGAVKQGAVFMSFDAFLEKAVEINLTSHNFSQALRGTDEKLMRQLSHYRKALSSNDIIDQIREYYQVIEDEYGKNDPRALRYLYIRNLVSHPVLNDPKAKVVATAIVGKNYLDPSSPKDLKSLETQLGNLKNEAKQIMMSKL